MTDQPDRAPNGQLLPGNTANPKGRATREQEKNYLEAIKRAIPPEQLEIELKAALALAKENKSARGMMAVLEFAASYALGKPKQTIESGKKTKFEELAPLYGLAPIDNEDEGEGD